MEKTMLNPRIVEENEKERRMMYENLRALRQEKGWSVRELSKISGIPEKSLANIEEGKNFKVHYLIQLCRLYHIEVYKIFSPIK